MGIESFLVLILLVIASVIGLFFIFAGSFKDEDGGKGLKRDGIRAFIGTLIVGVMSLLGVLLY